MGGGDHRFFPGFDRDLGDADDGNFILIFCLFDVLSFLPLSLPAGQLSGGVFGLSRSAGGFEQAPGAIFIAGDLIFLFEPKEVLAAGSVLFGFTFGLDALDCQELAGLRRNHAVWRGRQL